MLRQFLKDGVTFETDEESICSEDGDDRIGQ